MESFAGVEFPEMSPTEATAALYERHTMQLLQELMIGAESWTVQTPERFIFEALFANCGSSFGSHLEAFVQMLSLASSEEREPEIRLKIFIILASILQHRDHTLKLSVNPEPALIRLIQGIKLKIYFFESSNLLGKIKDCIFSFNINYYLFETIVSNGLSSPSV